MINKEQDKKSVIAKRLYRALKSNDTESTNILIGNLIDELQRVPKKRISWSEAFDRFFIKRQTSSYPQYYFDADICLCLDLLSDSKKSNKDYLLLLKQMVVDMSHFTEFNNCFDFSFILADANKPPAFEYHKASEDLIFNRSRLVWTENIRLNAAVLLLRQSIEQRIKEAIGLVFCRYEEKDVKLEIIIRSILQSKFIILKDKKSWEKLPKILPWLNHYLHHGLRPPSWHFYSVYKFLDQTLFQSGESIITSKIYSVYSGIEIKRVDINAFRDEMIEYISQKRQRPKNDLAIRWNDTLHVIVH